MSMLSLVSDALQKNTEIVIVGHREKNSVKELLTIIEDPRNTNPYRHEIYFFVASKTGLYTVDDLQKLMESLLPGVNQTDLIGFEDINGWMKFGSINMEEEIGEELISEKIFLYDPELFSIEGFSDGKALIEKKQTLKRKIVIKLFPNIEYARMIFNPNLQIVKKDIIAHGLNPDGISILRLQRVFDDPIQESAK